MCFWPPIDENAIGIIITNTSGLIPTHRLDQYNRERDRGLLRLCSGCKRFRLVDCNPLFDGARIFARLDAIQSLCTCQEDYVENRILQGELPIA